VILLAGLGLDRSKQGSGLGGDLLRDARARSVAAADEIGGQAVSVHAKDDTAASSYAKQEVDWRVDSLERAYRAARPTQLVSRR
jgi:hypothetical protein